jgi:hypothetical protein
MVRPVLNVHIELFESGQCFQGKLKKHLTINWLQKWHYCRG